MASPGPQPARSSRRLLIASLVVVLLGFVLLFTGAATTHHAYAWIGVVVLVVGLVGIRVATRPRTGHSRGR